ncbi:MAG: hypothetical protein A3A61_03870 [Candidatus Woykebacteria bacterium RIFCSPLOWO2_01_FULL_43_14]|uniref:HD domain-containing protein n=1 Tax=Candidatus Woykebacteria bacterium RIFCSPLOWO2_01_FULL_43_14 TaxID=1802605 RepID=A0A1G1WTU3_9BACT|nr:MAG: hypothetical protein A3A61_03870 [Candidatus Woykebacteria bacterium RIFCSPLOWO2_01_FULL_43_14]
MRTEEARLEELERIARDFNQSGTLTSGVVSKEDVRRAWDFFVQAARATRPKVWSSYFDHILSALNLGTSLAGFLKRLGFDIDINMVRFHLIIHDIGRLVYPDKYFENDRLATEIYELMGIPEPILRHSPHLSEILNFAADLGFTTKQVSGEEPISDQQLTAVWDYWDSHSLAHHIVSVADNLGKDGIRTPEELFNLVRTLYGTQTPSEGDGKATIVPSGAFFQNQVVTLTLHFLRALGLDFESLRAKLSNRGAKFVLLCGGSAANPQIPFSTLTSAWKNLKFDIALVAHKPGMLMAECELVRESFDATITEGLPQGWSGLTSRKSAVLLLGNFFAEDALGSLGLSTNSLGWWCIVCVLDHRGSLVTSYDLPLDIP